MIIENRIFTLLLAAAMILSAYFVLAYVGNIVFLFFLGIVLAYLLNPFIVRLESRGYARGKIVGGIYASVTLILIVAARVLVPLAVAALSNQKERLAEFAGLLQSMPMNLQRDLLSHLPVGSEQASTAMAAAQHWIERSVEGLPSALIQLSPKLLNILLIPFITFFAMVEGPGWVNGMIRACPNRHVEKVVSLIFSIDEVLGSYIRGLMLDSLFFGIATWIGLAVLGLNYALEVAIVAGMVNVVPYVGPMSAALLAAALAFVQFHDMAVLYKVVAVMVSLKLLDDWVIQPAIMRSKVNLHPMILLFAIMVGGDLFGFFGLVFAVPVAVTVQAAVKVFLDWYLAESGHRLTPFSRHVATIPDV